MPSIVRQIFAEIARVQGLLPQLDEAERQDAESLLRYARQRVEFNDYEGMRDALDELAALARPAKKEA